MKKYKLQIYCLTLGFGLLLMNPTFAKTTSKNTAVLELSNVISFIASNNSNFTLTVFLDKKGKLHRIKMNTLGVVLRINPDGHLERRKFTNSNIAIQYTDTSYQHISQVGNIGIQYTDTSYQHISQIGNIAIQYTDTSYQHVRRVGDIEIQYADTSYRNIIQVVGNQSGVEVLIGPTDRTRSTSGFFAASTKLAESSTILGTSGVRKKTRSTPGKAASTVSGLSVSNPARDT